MVGLEPRGEPRLVLAEAHERLQLVAVAAHFGRQPIELADVGIGARFDQPAILLQPEQQPVEQPEADRFAMADRRFRELDEARRHDADGARRHVLGPVLGLGEQIDRRGRVLPRHLVGRCAA
jgi:hypothetical protein